MILATVLLLSLAAIALYWELGTEDQTELDTVAIPVEVRTDEEIAFHSRRR
ncbi:hypothetical protein PN462_07965 [Spirulina sp. CS-785/01]|uniref:hypothetical protein n=1 Tax=Spirulina sp. CS-785/01 TaxID=3021716 RepID=UPI00232FDC72|nr:hypothetical protein [Spirulina sp. CS-785/01]MDB9313034.1 hypothetical protein [Spirulina sp. CS-785/01]